MNVVIEENQLAEIREKLDFIIEEISEQRRHRQEMEDLKSDLTLIAKDAFKSLVYELDDVSPFVDTGDFMHLFKKLLRNVNSITKTIEKFESAIDFMEDAGPIGRELFKDVLHKMDEFDRKRYFEFGKALGQGFERIVEEFPPEELQKFFDNMLIIARMMKTLMSSNFLSALEKAVNSVGEADIKQIDKFSPWMAHKELSKPEMRRAFGYLLYFFTSLVSELRTNNNNKKEA